MGVGGAFGVIGRLPPLHLLQLGSPVILVNNLDPERLVVFVCLWCVHVCVCVFV